MSFKNSAIPIFCNDIALIIAKYTVEKTYKIQEHVFEKFKSSVRFWRNFSKNPNINKVLHLLEENIDVFINDEETLNNLSMNSNAFDFFENKHHLIDWDSMSSNTNPKAIELLKQNIDKILWEIIGSNPAAIDLIKENIDKIEPCNYINNPAAIDLIKENINEHHEYYYICENPNVSEIFHLMNLPPEYCWHQICKNPKNMRIIQSYPLMINWDGLSRNTNPNAVRMCIKNSDQIIWDLFVQNPSPLAINYIKKNKNKVFDYSDALKWIFYNKNPKIISVLKYIIDQRNKKIVINNVLESPHYEKLLKYMKINIESLKKKHLKILSKNENIIILNDSKYVENINNLYKELISL